MLFPANTKNNKPPPSRIERNWELWSKEKSIISFVSVAKFKFQFNEIWSRARLRVFSHDQTGSRSRADVFHKINPKAFPAMKPTLFSINSNKTFMKFTSPTHLLKLYLRATNGCSLQKPAISSQLEILISRSYTRLIHHPSICHPFFPTIISFN